MSGTHTPGPWEIRRPRYGKGLTREIWGVDGKCVTGMTERMTTGVTTEANARLIAAAPELMGALEWLADSGEVESPEALAVIRDAIARATV